MKKVSYLMDSWNLEEELNKLPDSELKQTILDWKSRQQIVSGAMSLSGIYYRQNLQYILENLDKKGLIDEIRNAGTPHPKEYGQLLLKHGRQFKQVFGVNLQPYMDLITGFDIVKFDEEIVKPPDGTSTKQAVEKRWGKPAVELIMSLM